MQWSDSAIILSTRKMGENSVIARIFSQNHGVGAGVVRGAHSAKKRGIIQPGNSVKATWQARLAEQLGSLSCEMETARAAFILGDGQKLLALQTLCSLLEQTFPEGHPYPQLYARIIHFLDLLTGDAPWLDSYVLLEMAILSEAGFGVDLSCCAATGQKHDLYYISPKSGRAVCRDAGAPYHDKMLPLPSFFLSDPPTINTEELLAGLKTSGYFLEHWLLAPHNRSLPPARGRMIQQLHSKILEPA